MRLRAGGWCEENFKQKEGGEIVGKGGITEVGKQDF